ncbi:hypothetical protein MATL_G00166610 [Megalops atlanticus]|uniref:CRIB domain-containing protein n=1 Tax=Megalops atlanticus TaxID=7932 RepID=A0A9D3PT08_MEGAT|nr:hypothetical protein MATL_G00166610 [Megalops atlanticus]
MLHQRTAWPLAGKTGGVLPKKREAAHLPGAGHTGAPWCFPDRPAREASHRCSVKGPRMSAKAPIYLKRGSRKGKKEKLRDILSSDMISPPLGDFRHTIHIGSGGGENDLFGDLSFLQGRFHLLPGRQRSSQGGEPFQFTRTASVCGHPPTSESSPLLKNAISLPVIGGASPETERRPQDPEERPYLSHAGSLLSLHLDLGPSILDDVLQIMDKHRVSSMGGACVHGGRQEIFT